MVKDYLGNLDTIAEDVNTELIRVKEFVNTKGYHNGTAVNQIVKRYRKELKVFLETVSEDLQDT